VTVSVYCQDLIDTKYAYSVRSKLSIPHNNFIEEDDLVLDEEQHFVGTGLTILIFGLGILIFGSGTKVAILYFHFSPRDTSC